MSDTPIAAMLLAAGRGERMRPLTDSCPKPLLAVRGKPLLRWHLEALVRGGVNRVVINTAWLGERIEQSLGSKFVLERQSGAGFPAPLRLPRRYAARNDSQRGNCAGTQELLAQQSLQIEYSREGRDFGAALETAGGICRALPLLCPGEHAGVGGDVFWLLAGDVFVPGFKFPRAAMDRFIASAKLAHLWLVANPSHHPGGDFGLDCTSALALNLAADDARAHYTYSSIGLYRKALFAPPWCSIASGNPQGLKVPLAPLLRAAMDNALVSAELYQGVWTDVGTPERLQHINQASDFG